MRTNIATVGAPGETREIRWSERPSITYKWAGLAFNWESGIDQSKLVRWYSKRRDAEAHQQRLYGARYVLVRAPHPYQLAPPHR